MPIKLAAIQMCSGVDPQVNAAAMARLVRDAAAQGAIYVQTPEMTGALQRDRAGLRAILRDESDDLILAEAAALASDLSIFVHIGSTAIARADGKIANRSFLLGPDGRLICSYDKIHMFDVDLDHGQSWRESAAYEAGTEARVATLPFGRLGFAICYDVRFPQLFRAEALAGAEILTVPAAFTRSTGEAHWEILLRARAIENGAFVVAAAQAGIHEDGRETYGHSMIIDPWGRILGEAGGEGEAVVMAEIDMEAVHSARAKIPNLVNAREFALDRVEPMAGGVTG
ncbi:carbon-nitrogen hydrolase family protein [Rhizobium sp. SSA_523]|uniref:carbon-nitrogen hydrolase family protein n=1 Tax=Rhizobium sp. SSA_523 TaxID=2952477 RepID=UPI002091ADBA|nr:carbon-nitrogen hydrolase family protein [Rhizobium sp. SSA_523]MCO5733706.1 carbon-nitrogen hydrolase family protein [Rhizobium sp. SSA_523]WKC25739.1 carbon-nitrogen hydrolase family protein [Rhizobium sp. SSA_523]